MAKERRPAGTCVSWNRTHKKWVGYVQIGVKTHPRTGKEVPDLVYCRSPIPGRAGERAVEDALALVVRNRHEALKAEKKAADPQNYTLWQAILDWHAWVPSQADTSQQTADKLLGQARKHVEPAIRGVSVFDLDTEILTNFFEKAAGNLGRSSLSDLKSTITRALAYAMRRKSETHYTGPNPGEALGSWLPEAGRKPRAKDFLTQDQAEGVIAAAAGTRMHALVMLGFMLGLRPGEIRALKWEDVELGKAKLYVVKYLKTKTSRRGFDVPARLLEALRRHLEDYGESKTGHVFVTEDGRQHDKDTLSWRFEVLMRKAGMAMLDPEIYEIKDPYVMRHSFASICYHNDVKVKDISRMMGHANESITLRIYIHLFNPDVVETGDLDGIWAKAS